MFLNLADNEWTWLLDIMRQRYASNEFLKGMAQHDDARTAATDQKMVITFLRKLQSEDLR